MSATRLMLAHRYGTQCSDAMFERFGQIVADEMFGDEGRSKTMAVAHTTPDEYLINTAMRFRVQVEQELGGKRIQQSPTDEWTIGSGIGTPWEGASLVRLNLSKIAADPKTAVKQADLLAKEVNINYVYRSRKRVGWDNEYPLSEMIYIFSLVPCPFPAALDRVWMAELIHRGRPRLPPTALSGVSRQQPKTKII